MASPKTKAFGIPKQLIWDAYLQVSKSQGATGVDKVSITKFEENLKRWVVERTFAWINRNRRLLNSITMISRMVKYPKMC